jgi:hypothetical protein
MFKTITPSAQDYFFAILGFVVSFNVGFATSTSNKKNVPVLTHVFCRTP